MRELRGDLRLADEAEHVTRLRLAFREHHFHRHIAAERVLVRLVDGAGAALHDDSRRGVALRAEEIRRQRTGIRTRAGRRAGTRVSTEPISMWQSSETGVRTLCGLAVDARAIRAVEVLDENLSVALDGELCVPRGHGRVIHHDLAFFRSWPMT